MNVTLSIHHVHALGIYNGTKKYEFRRCVPKKLNVGDFVWLYETAPIKKVTGFFVFGGYIATDVNSLCEKTAGCAGVSFAELYRYFTGKKTCHAMMIERPTRLDTPFEPTWKKPPQNFIYGSAWEL